MSPDLTSMTYTKQHPRCPSTMPTRGIIVEPAPTLSSPCRSAWARLCPQRQPTELDLDGARDLIAALTELVEAVEEGTR